MQILGASVGSVTMEEKDVMMVQRRGGRMRATKMAKRHHVGGNNGWKQGGDEKGYADEW